MPPDNKSIAVGESVDAIAGGGGPLVREVNVKPSRALRCHVVEHSGIPHGRDGPAELPHPVDVSVADGVARPDREPAEMRVES